MLRKVISRLQYLENATKRQQEEIHALTEDKAQLMEYSHQLKGSVRRLREEKVLSAQSEDQLKATVEKQQEQIQTLKEELIRLEEYASQLENSVKNLTSEKKTCAYTSPDHDTSSPIVTCDTKPQKGELVTRGSCMYGIGYALYN